MSLVPFEDPAEYEDAIEAQMTNEKPTNPSHGELLDDLITLVMIRVGERKQVNEGRVAELRSLILGKMGEGEKELAAILRFEGEGDEWFIPAEPGPLGPFPFVEAVKEFMAFMDREFSKLDATASRLQSELEEARKGQKHTGPKEAGMTVVEAEVKALIKFYERRGWSWAYVAEFTLARASGTLFPDS